MGCRLAMRAAFASLPILGLACGLCIQPAGATKGAKAPPIMTGAWTGGAVGIRKVTQVLRIGTPAGTQGFAWRQVRTPFTFPYRKSPARELGLTRPLDNSRPVAARSAGMEALNALSLAPRGKAERLAPRVMDGLGEPLRASPVEGTAPTTELSQLKSQMEGILDYLNQEPVRWRSKEDIGGAVIERFRRMDDIGSFPREVRAGWFSKRTEYVRVDRELLEALQGLPTTIRIFLARPLRTELWPTPREQFLSDIRDFLFGLERITEKSETKEKLLSEVRWLVRSYWGDNVFR